MRELTFGEIDERRYRLSLMRPSKKRFKRLCNLLFILERIRCLTPSDIWNKSGK